MPSGRGAPGKRSRSDDLATGRTRAGNRGGYAAAAALVFTVFGCATGGGGADILHRLYFNGQAVEVTENQTILDVARARSPVYRLGQFERGGLTPPRFFVDHVEIMDGPSWIGHVRATGVDSVRVLPPTAAITRFGGSARGGAVLIFTRH